VNHVRYTDNEPLNVITYHVKKHNGDYRKALNDPGIDILVSAMLQAKRYAEQILYYESMENSEQYKGYLAAKALRFADWTSWMRFTDQFPTEERMLVINAHWARLHQP